MSGLNVSPPPLSSPSGFTGKANHTVRLFPDPYGTVLAVALRPMKAEGGTINKNDKQVIISSAPNTFLIVRHCPNKTDDTPDLTSVVYKKKKSHNAKEVKRIYVHYFRQLHGELWWKASSEVVESH